MSDPPRLTPAAQRLVIMARSLSEYVQVPSPCVSVCRISPTSQLCEGCWRSLDEIAAWSSLTSDDKRRVWAELVGRIQQLPSP